MLQDVLTDGHLHSQQSVGQLIQCVHIVKLVASVETELIRKGVAWL